MRRLQLYIGTERVDLFKDETVSLTQTIQNVKDIKKIFTEFTQTFSVPASKTNNIIFKHYYNFNISNGYDARIKQNATLELNDLPFKIGKIRLDGVDLKNNLAHTYRITFFGNTVDLKDILSNSQLSSLTGLAAYNQVYSYTAVKAAIQNYAAGSNNNILVPLITHTDRMFYNSTDDVDTNIYTNVYSSSFSAFADNGINWNQFKYAIRVQTIIDAIQSQGYANGQTITFSNDFFNDQNNLKFNNLFLWLHRKKGSVEGIEQVSLNFTQLNQLNSGNCTPLGQCNNDLATASNGLLAVDAGSQYSFNLSLSITPPSGVTYSVRVVSSNGDIRTGGANGTTTTFSNFSNNQTYSIELDTASPATFAANSIVWTLTWQFIGGTGQGSAGSIQYFNPTAFSTTADVDFNINSQIPKMSIIDFLTGLFQMFNLTAYVDESGTIVVRTLDSYYSSSISAAINIDQYLDTTKSVVDVALPFNKVNFKYKGLGTFLAKQYEQLSNSGWGSEIYTLDGDIFDAPTDSYNIELPFEHVMYERLYNMTGAASTTIQYGYFVDDNREAYFGEPLLFYPIRQTGATRIAFRNTNPNAKSFISNYFIPSNSLALSPLTSKTNIHFRPMINEYLANELGDTANDFTDTLFKTNYEAYIQDVFNLQRRLTKVTAFLPYKIFSSLQLNNKIQLGQNDYRINSIKTNLTNGKTEFELLNTIQ